MQEKQARFDTVSAGWPFFQMPESGMNSLNEGFAVYRNLMNGMADIARQYLSGNYDDIISKWRKNLESGSQEMMDIFLRPFQQADSLKLPEGTLFGRNLLQYWQQYTGRERTAESAASHGTEELAALYERVNRSAFDWLGAWNGCLSDLAEAYRASSTRWNKPARAWDTWLSACEAFRDAVTAANISFTEVQADAYNRFLKSFIPEKMQMEEEIHPDDKPEHKKTVKKGRV
jgi:hypothetical protein